MKRLGCFWTCSFALITIIVIIIGGGYLALFHSSLPLKAIAAAISQDGNVRIEGVTGTLSRGFHVERVEVKDHGRPPSEIEDIEFRYQGTGWGKTDHVVIEEASVGKATLYVNLQPSITVEKSDKARQPTEDPTTTDQPPDVGESDRKSFQFLQIKRVSLNNLIIKDLVHNFELSIPRIEWTGFQIEKGRIDPGSLTVESDRLDLQTMPGQTAEADPQLAFQKRIVATIKPKLHPTIREPINATLDLSVNLKGPTDARLSAFEGALTADLREQKSGRVQLQKLDLGRFFHGGDFELPNQLSLDVQFEIDQSTRSHKIDLRSGSFRLGVVDFTVEPQQPMICEHEPCPLIFQATGRARDVVYYYTLTLSPSAPAVRQELRSDPPLPPEELLAGLLFGIPYQELTDEQKSSIDRKRELYFPSEQATEPIPDPAVEAP